MPRIVVQSEPSSPPPASQDRHITAGKRKSEQCREDQHSDEEPVTRYMPPRKARKKALDMQMLAASQDPKGASRNRNSLPGGNLKALHAVAGEIDDDAAWKDDEDIGDLDDEEPAGIDRGVLNVEDEIEDVDEDDDELAGMSPEQLAQVLENEKPVWAEPRKSRHVATGSDGSTPSPPSPPPPPSPPLRFTHRPHRNTDASRASARVPAMQFGASDDEAHPMRHRGTTPPVSERTPDRSQAGKVRPRFAMQDRQGGRHSRAKDRARVNARVTSLEARPPQSGKRGQPARTGQKSRRQAAYEQEQPTWQSSDDEDGLAQMTQTSRRRSQPATTVSRCHRAMPSDETPSQLDDAQWPPSTRLVLPQGRNPLSLTAQNSQIKDVLHDAIKRVEHHLAFIHAFPELKAKTQFLRQHIYDCAKARGYREIADRARHDVQYVKWMASIPNQRMANIRSAIRQTIASQIVVNYGLDRSNPDRTVERVRKLLRDKQYIFPGDVDRQLDYSKPYEHPLIVEAISEGFFKNADSIGNICADELVSSMPDEFPDERELPACMVAAAATSVHASLREWDSGVRTQIKFSSMTYANTFDEHMEILEDVRTSHPVNYHQMMSKLLRLIRTPKTQSHEASVNNTLRLIKFA
ncbi:hypothetical protein FOMPIDRAFT_110498 [Fomitopsis schrenkii]|uniref:DUF6532 domain-containing protein n=1 Tax=Fomitopsis schrenkii TaxID=2126942 RepID=S8G3F3_FOMSC|nr:hypothetical protein FOMPIDRAFT_110498 [Fomitopsis schrenkii]